MKQNEKQMSEATEEAMNRHFVGLMGHIKLLTDGPIDCIRIQFDDILK